MIGRPARDSARYLVDALDLPITPEDYLREREVLFRTLMPTAEAHARARASSPPRCAPRGVPLAVATSSARPLYDLKTHASRRLVRRFRRRRHRRRPRVARGKPAPDIYLLAARELGVDAARGASRSRTRPPAWKPRAPRACR